MMVEESEVEQHQQNLSTLESKVTFLEAEKTILEAVEVSLRKEVDELKHDKREVVSKFVLYAVIELVHSDDMSSLVGRLVSSAVLYGRRRAYEQVVDMKEPFNFSKVKGYHPSAPIGKFMSKKPPSSSKSSFPSELKFPLPYFSESYPILASKFPIPKSPSPPTDASVLESPNHLHFNEVVRGFASIHLVECSMATAKNFNPHEAIDRGPRMLTPQ
ncbi:hypothetical protein Tco_0304106 [Tanacetum coccineum]